MVRRMGSNAAPRSSMIRVAAASLTLVGVACATVPPAPARVYTEDEVREIGTEMSTFLSSLVQRQQEYQRAEGRYAPTLLDLSLARPTGYEVRIVEANERGWSAEAFRASPRIGCSVFAGIVSALPQPTNMVQSQAGTPYCVFVPEVD